MIFRVCKVFFDKKTLEKRRINLLKITKSHLAFSPEKTAVFLRQSHSKIKIPLNLFWMLAKYENNIYN